jgi:hypothetical protein
MERYTMHNQWKADIIGQFSELFKDSKKYQEFFKINDIGVPLAYLSSNGMATPTVEGEEMIQETWLELCKEFDTDPQAMEDYSPQDIEEFIDLASGKGL